MRFLANENITATVIQGLRQRGDAVLSVKESMRSEQDDVILARAQLEQRIVLTHDKDFGELVFRQRRLATGVVLLRLAGLSPGAKASIVSTVIRDHASELPGAFTVVSPGMVRIRPQL